MRAFNRLLIAGLCLIGLPVMAADRPLAVQNVSVIDATGTPIKENQTVIVVNGRITAIGSAANAAVPPDAVVVDGTGQFLIPGLWDMHVHLTDTRSLDLYLAYGVTGVRHMYSVSPFFRLTKDYRKPEPGRTRIVPSNGALDGSGTVFPRLAAQNLHKVATAAEARTAVRQMHRAGDEFIKVFSALPRDTYFAAADEARKERLPLVGHVPYAVTAAEASDAGQRSIEHLDGVPIACSSEPDAFARQQTAAFEPLAPGRSAGVEVWRIQLKAHDAYEPERAKALFAKFVRNSTWQVPTLLQNRALSRLADERFVADPRLTELPESLRMLWKIEKGDGTLRVPMMGIRMSAADLDGRRLLYEAELKLVREMHRAGVPILAGTDAPNPYCFPGSGLHDELELLVAAGLTPMEALQTATRNPARYLDREADAGTIEVGKLADLVLLEANPLEKIGNIRQVSAVVSGGRFLSQAELTKLKNRESSVAQSRK
jgi:imidazolonepropionase-like amidohydrolase